MMHYVQKHIIDLLRSTESLRYSELQPDDIESSHFKYHLDQLIKAGFVRQQSRGVYALSVKGKSEVDRLSSGTVNPKISPKVITYTLLHNSEFYFLHQKEKEPYLGLLNMIGGKVHIGESTHQAAVREVEEKIGATLPEPHLIGIAEIRISQNSELLTHAVAYMYEQILQKDEDFSGKLTAVPKTEIESRVDLAPDLLRLLASLEKDSVAIIDLDIDYN